MIVEGGSRSFGVLRIVVNRRYVRKLLCGLMLCVVVVACCTLFVCGRRVFSHYFLICCCTLLWWVVVVSCHFKLLVWVVAFFVGDVDRCSELWLQVFGGVCCCRFVL